ncbi:chromosome partitioning protein [Nitrobacteraceae bacterium AZCC 2146]
MQVVSFMNMKGGVGKTTLAVNVAYALAHQHGKQVLVVDGDPQFNATQCLLDDEDYLAHIKAKGTLKDIFIPRRAGAVNTTTGLAKVAGKTKMSLADCTVEIYAGMHGKPGRLDLLPNHLSIIEAEMAPRGAEKRLKSFLKERASKYDYVIIDCPPTISFFTQAAMLASDKYLVPIKPDWLSVVGLPLLERYIEDFTDDAGMKLQQVGLVFTMVTGPVPQAMKQVMDQIRKERKTEVFKDYLSQSTNVTKSVTERLPVFLYKKASAKIKLQVLDITLEFLKRTGK